MFTDSEFIVTRENAHLKQSLTKVWIEEIIVNQMAIGFYIVVSAIDKIKRSTLQLWEFASTMTILFCI